MYISLPCLQSFVNLKQCNLDINTLENKLGLAGFELEEINKNTVLNKNNLNVDIATTANRSDILNLVGLSREIAFIFGADWVKNHKFRNYNLLYEPIFISQFNEQFNIRDDKFCSEFFYLNIQLNSTLIIPTWIKRRLQACNIEQSNTLLDVTNYVMLEWGASFQCYDLDKIKLGTSSSKSIDYKIQLLDKPYHFISSEDNKECSLKPGTMIDTINDICVGISGICVKKGFEVCGDSKNILILMQAFDAKQIRRSIRLSSIRNEHCIRHEKQVGYQNLSTSVKRLKTILFLISNRSIYQFIAVLRQQPKEEKVIQVKFKSILEILGDLNLKSLDEQRNKIFALLNALNLRVKSYNKNLFHVYVPFYRQFDLKEEIDIIEEIARGFGFKQFKSVLPSKTRLGKIPKSRQFEEKIRKTLISKGFYEVYHSSFCSSNEYSPEIINPLTTDLSSIRANLIEEFIKRLSFNQNNNKSLMNYFEFGSIFYKDKSDLNKYSESLHFSGIFSDLTFNRNWHKEIQALSWYEAFGVLEGIFEQLKIQFRVKKFVVSNLNSYFNPRQVVEILNSKDDKILGYFGKLHPKVYKNLDLSKNIYIFEIDFTALVECATSIYSDKLKCGVYSSFPTLSYNLIFSISNNLAYSTIINEISAYTKSLINTIKIQIFNVDQTEVNTLLGLKLTFQSNEGTLLKLDTDLLVEDIKTHFIKKYCVEFQ